MSKDFGGTRYEDKEALVYGEGYDCSLNQNYKTEINIIEKGEEYKLIEKYQEQLNLYKEALEKALNRKVNKVSIYSTWVGEILIKKLKEY